MQMLRLLLMWLGFDVQYQPAWSVILGVLGITLVVVVVLVGIWLAYSGLIIVLRSAAAQRAGAIARAAELALQAAKRETELSQFRAASDREMADVKVQNATRRAQLETELAQAQRELVEARDGPIRAARTAEMAAQREAQVARNEAEIARAAAVAARNDADQAASRAGTAEAAQRQAWLDLDSAMKRQQDLEQQLTVATDRIQELERRRAEDDRLAGMSAELAQLRSLVAPAPATVPTAAATPATVAAFMASAAPAVAPAPAPCG